MTVHPITSLYRLSLELLDLLFRERDCLIRLDVTPLSELLKRKEECLSALVRQEQAWRQALNQARVTMDKTAIDDWLARLGDRDLRRNWTALCALAPIVQEQNQITALIALRTQRSTQRLLEILRGEPTMPRTYQASGLHSKQRWQRSLGLA